MSLVYTHTLPGCPVGLEELLLRQSAVAAFGRVVVVATPSGVDFYDGNSVTELSTVLDAGACKLRLLSSFPVVDAGQPVDVSAVTFLGSGLLALAGWAGGASVVHAYQLNVSTKASVYTEPRAVSHAYAAGSSAAAAPVFHSSVQTSILPHLVFRAALPGAPWVRLLPHATRPFLLGVTVAGADADGGGAAQSVRFYDTDPSPRSGGTAVASGRREDACAGAVCLPPSLMGSPPLPTHGQPWALGGSSSSERRPPGVGGAHVRLSAMSADGRVLALANDRAEVAVFLLDDGDGGDDGGEEGGPPPARYGLGGRTQPQPQPQLQRGGGKADPLARVHLRGRPLGATASSDAAGVAAEARGPITGTHVLTLLCEAPVTALAFAPLPAPPHAGHFARFRLNGWAVLTGHANGFTNVWWCGDIAPPPPMQAAPAVAPGSGGVGPSPLTATPSPDAAILSGPAILRRVPFAAAPPPPPPAPVRTAPDASYPPFHASRGAVLVITPGVVVSGDVPAQPGAAVAGSSGRTVSASTSGPASSSSARDTSGRTGGATVFLVGALGARGWRQYTLEHLHGDTWAAALPPPRAPPSRGGTISSSAGLVRAPSGRVWAAPDLLPPQFGYDRMGRRHVVPAPALDVTALTTPWAHLPTYAECMRAPVVGDAAWATAVSTALTTSDSGDLRPLPSPFAGSSGSARETAMSRALEAPAPTGIPGGVPPPPLLRVGAGIEPRGSALIAWGAGYAAAAGALAADPWVLGLDPPAAAPTQGAGPQGSGEVSVFGLLTSGPAGTTLPGRYGALFRDSQQPPPPSIPALLAGTQSLSTRSFQGSSSGPGSSSRSSGGRGGLADEYAQAASVASAAAALTPALAPRAVWLLLSERGLTLTGADYHPVAEFEPPPLPPPRQRRPLPDAASAPAPVTAAAPLRAGVAAASGVLMSAPPPPQPPAPLLQSADPAEAGAASASTSASPPPSVTGDATRSAFTTAAANRPRQPSPNPFGTPTPSRAGPGAVAGHAFAAGPAHTWPASAPPAQSRAAGLFYGDAVSAAARPPVLHRRSERSPPPSNSSSPRSYAAPAAVARNTRTGRMAAATTASNACGSTAVPLAAPKLEGRSIPAYTPRHTAERLRNKQYQPQPQQQHKEAPTRASQMDAGAPAVAALPAATAAAAAPQPPPATTVSAAASQASLYARRPPAAAPATPAPAPPLAPAVPADAPSDSGSPSAAATAAAAVPAPAPTAPLPSPPMTVAALASLLPGVQAELAALRREAAILPTGFAALAAAAATAAVQAAQRHQQAPRESTARAAVSTAQHPPPHQQHDAGAKGGDVTARTSHHAPRHTSSFFTADGGGGGAPAPPAASAPLETPLEQPPAGQAVVPRRRDRGGSGGSSSALPPAHTMHALRPVETAPAAAADVCSSAAPPPSAPPGTPQCVELEEGGALPPVQRAAKAAGTALARSTRSSTLPPPRSDPPPLLSATAMPAPSAPPPLGSPADLEGAVLAGDPLRDRGAGAGFAFAPHCTAPAAAAMTAAAPPLLPGPPLPPLPEGTSQQLTGAPAGAALVASSSPPPQPSAPPATPHGLDLAQLQQPVRRAPPTQPHTTEAAAAAPSPRGPPRLSVAVSVEGVDAQGALAVPVAAAAALPLLLPAEAAGEDDVAACTALTAPSPIIGSSTLPGRQVSSVGPLRAAAATDAVAAGEAETAESCSEEALPPRETPLLAAAAAAAAVGRTPPRPAAAAAARGAAESPPDPLLSPSSSLLVAPTLDDVGLPSRAAVSWADAATTGAVAPARGSGDSDAPFAATRTAGASLVESALAALALSRAVVDSGDASLVAPPSSTALLHPPLLAERRSFPANSTATGALGGGASAAAVLGAPLPASAAVVNADGVDSLWGSRTVCEGEAAAAAACSGGYALVPAAASQLDAMPEDRQSGSGDDDDEEDGGSQGLMFLSADPAPPRGVSSSSTRASLLPAALVPPTSGSLAVSYRGRLLQRGNPGAYASAASVY